MSKKRVELQGVKENFRKRDLGKKWKHLEENTKKEIPDEVNLSHYGKKLEEMGPHHLLSLVWRWKHPTATMIWLLPDLRREINTSQLKKGEQGRCGRSGMQMFCEKPWTITKKQHASLSTFLTDVLSSMLFFILPLNKMSSVGPDTVSQFWAQLPQVISNIHHGPTDFTNHTYTGAWENTLLDLRKRRNFIDI